MRRLSVDPRWWPSLVVYGGVMVAGRAKGGWKARFGNLEAWERAERHRPSPGPVDRREAGEMRP